MRVYQCDRCKKYVKRTARDFFVRKPTRGIYRISKKIHLCHDCANNFRMWLLFDNLEEKEERHGRDGGEEQ